MHAALLDSLKPKTSALGQKLTNGLVWVCRPFSLDAELLRECTAEFLEACLQ
jgi:hypothetical protein